MELSFGKVAIILILAFIIFGSKKLPEFGKAAGKTLLEFKKAIKDISSNEDIKK